MNGNKKLIIIISIMLIIVAAFGIINVVNAANNAHLNLDVYNGNADSDDMGGRR